MSPSECPKYTTMLVCSEFGLGTSESSSETSELLGFLLALLKHVDFQFTLDCSELGLGTSKPGSETSGTLLALTGFSDFS